MKTITCKDLGGPCDEAFSASSFEELGQKSRAHVMDKIAAGDEAHAVAAEKMKNATPSEREAAMMEFKRRFDDAPEN